MLLYFSWSSGISGFLQMSSLSLKSMNGCIKSSNTCLTKSLNPGLSNFLIISPTKSVLAISASFFGFAIISSTILNPFCFLSSIVSYSLF